MVRLLTLIAAAVLPVALVVCAGVVLTSKAHGGCGLGYGASRWLADGLYALAALIPLRVLWVGARALRATRAAAVPRGAMRALPRLPIEGRRVAFVLPVDEPLAYTAGIGRGQVVVSRGLLVLLDDEERRALLAHELAHLRAGHQRMLFVGEVVAGALGFVRPVRSAFASFRRAIEVAADAQAAQAVGDPRVVARAIAKTALASSSAVGVPLAGPSDLLERLERLASPPPRSAPASAAVAAAGALVVVALVLSVCLALHTGPLAANAMLCLAVLAAIALPPLVRLRGGTGVPVRSHVG